MLNVFFYYLLFLYMFSIMVVLHRHSISSLYLSELNSFHLRPFGGHLCKRKGLYLLTENLWVMQLILKQLQSTSPWSIETTVEILNAKGLIKNLHYIFFQFTSVLAKKKRRYLKSLQVSHDEPAPFHPHKSCCCLVMHCHDGQHLSPQSKPGKKMFRKYWSCYLSKRLREGFAYL